MLVLDEAHKLRNLYGVDPPPQVAECFRKALERPAVPLCADAHRDADPQPAVGPLFAGRSPDCCPRP